MSHWPDATLPSHLSVRYYYPVLRSISTLHIVMTTRSSECLTVDDIMWVVLGGAKHLPVLLKLMNNTDHTCGLITYPQHIWRCVLLPRRLMDLKTYLCDLFCAGQRPSLMILQDLGGVTTHD